MTACPDCGEDERLETLALMDCIDPETGRSYAAYEYRCGTCDTEFVHEFRDQEP